MNRTRRTQSESETSGGVLVILPVLNEAANIAALLDRIEIELLGMPFTIAILDDGSTDGTIEIIQARMQRPDHHLHLARRKKIHRSSQRGSALRQLMLYGIEHTAHDVLVEMDGDLSHRPEELRDGIRLVRESRCDIAIASKYVAGSVVTNRPWGRRLVSKLGNYAVRGR